MVLRWFKTVFVVILGFLFSPSKELLWTQHQLTNATIASALFLLQGLAIRSEGVSGGWKAWLGLSGLYKVLTRSEDFL